MDRSDVLSTLQETASEVLGVEAGAVVEEARFKEDLDADSLDVIELVMALEERLDVTIPEQELEGIATVGDALSLLTEKLAARA
jgi:acyl carrier protein